MDCAAEAQMVRDALSGLKEVRQLQFDLPGRRLVVIHEGEPNSLAQRLEALGLGAALESSESSGDASDGRVAKEGSERETLQLLLAINAAMFLLEHAAGWIASSAGLLADSLDMLADALVYGIALYAVGRAEDLKRRAAHMSGWLQLALALGAFSEVVRRFIFGSEPEPGYMMGVAFVALAANIACMLLISRHREGGVHMRASWIFSTNDVVANMGVIAAGGLVAWTGSRVPDLFIGAVIGAVVLSGSIRILKLK